MNEKVTKTDIIVFASIFFAMIVTLLYGFFFAGVGKVDNCWDKYTTEYDAILNCEGVELHE
jgi:hypothetical protein